MAYKTVLELVVEVEKAIYQSAGPQVQVYSQDILAQMVRQAFSHFFEKRYWPQYRVREQRTLDGVTGQITVDLSHIQRWEDIQHVFWQGSQRPLPHLPTDFNTLNMQGSTPRYIEAAPNSKLFTVYPLTAVNDVLVVGRKMPDISAMDSPVPCDEHFIVHFAAWSYFIDDDSNPAAASKHQALFEGRLKQLESASYSHAVQLDPHAVTVPDRWYES